MKGSLNLVVSHSTLPFLRSNLTRISLLLTLSASSSNLTRISPLLTLSASSSRLLSSKTSDPSESNLSESSKGDGDVSNEELKEQWGKLLQGDEKMFNEAFPTVFQAMMSRALAGMSHEEIRDEFSCFIRGKNAKESDSD